MIVISPFNTRKKYTKEAVDQYITDTYPKVKYYGFYERKKPTPMMIYRFYELQSTDQKKLYPYSPRFFSAGKENR